MAMAMAMAKKQKEFGHKLRHKSDCCCLGWAVYAPWACYMNLRALYNPNADFAADHRFSVHVHFTNLGLYFVPRPISKIK
jgi:hypothetical protein